MSPFLSWTNLIFDRKPPKSAEFFFHKFFTNNFAFFERNSFHQFLSILKYKKFCRMLKNLKIIKKRLNLENLKKSSLIQRIIHRLRAFPKVFYTNLHIFKGTFAYEKVPMAKFSSSINSPPLKKTFPHRRLSNFFFFN